MQTYRNEPAILRLCRAAVSVLPKGRSAVVRRVASLTGNRAPFLASVRSNRFLIDLNEIVSRTLYLYGTFEPAVTALLPKLLKPGATVLDVGANFGYFTVLAAKAAGPAGKIYAFEPDPRNVDRLLAVVAANDLKNVIHVPEGAFDKKGTVTFHLVTDAEDNLGGSSIVAAGHGRAQIQIPVTTLDSFCSERGIASADLMKMDIEGAEFEAMAGASQLIANHAIKQVLIEMHVEALGQDRAKTIADRLLAAGYHGYVVREHTGAAFNTIAEFLQPLAASHWLSEPNPHCLFTVEPIPGVK